MGLLEEKRHLMVCLGARGGGLGGVNGGVPTQKGGNMPHLRAREVFWGNGTVFPPFNGVFKLFFQI